MPHGACIESGDDEILSHVDKGYAAADILEGCEKLEKAGVDCQVIYIGGMAGRGKAMRASSLG